MSSQAPIPQNPSPASYYQTNPRRRGLLGHISLGVPSITISEPFYTAILAPFGITPVFRNPDNTTIGYGSDVDSEVFTLFERGEDALAPGKGTHIAFNAPSRRAVREFWEAGVENGGTCNGEPGVRERYGEDYYAAFLVGPEGWRVETVFQEKVGVGKE